MKKYIKKYYLVWITAICLVAVDLLTKFIFDGKIITIIPNVFSIYSTYNTGSAFGAFSNQTLWLICLSIIFLAVIITFDKFHKEEDKLYLFSYSLIIAGAVGNLIDRVFFGYVRDFIRIDFFDFTNINTVFNVADICVTVGVVLMLIYFLKSIIKEKKKKND